jgi:hypothetical protein
MVALNSIGMVNGSNRILGKCMYSMVHVVVEYLYVIQGRVNNFIIVR